MKARIKAFLERHRELIVYVVVGGLTTVIGTGGYWLFVWLGIDPAPANVLSWIFAVAFAFVANKIFVFEDKSNGFAHLIAQLLKFIAARLFSLAVETFLIWLGTERFDMNKYLVKIPVAVLVVVLNYITGKFVVFVKNKR